MKVGDKIIGIRCDIEGAEGVIETLDNGEIEIRITKSGKYFKAGHLTHKSNWQNCFEIIREETMWDKETTQAIKESVVRWEDSIGKLKRDIPISLGSNVCPLCRFTGFYPSSDSSLCHKKCPLGIRGMVCGDDDSPYSIFELNRTPQNARNMVLALKSLFYPEKKKVFYRRGQIFINKEFRTEHILAQISDKNILLIGLDDGNRWKAATTVNDTGKITEKEFKQICGSGTFTLKEGK